MADPKKQIQVHPLSSNPDECYQMEKNRGTYRNLLRQDLDDLKKDGKTKSVRFVCISDTHNRTDELESSLPHGDVLIHAGDFTNASIERDIIHFNDFLGKVKQRFKHILVIAGNHELSFDKKTCDDNTTLRQFIRQPFKNLTPDQSKGLLTNCTYLEDESIELYGIKIYGSPWQPWFYNLAFNRTRGEQMLEKWAMIPEDTDILVTHGPPLGIGDNVRGVTRAGCAELLSTIMERVFPKYHIFGHIHENYGVWNNGQTTFINASTVNLRYDPVNKPVVFDYESTELSKD